MIKVELVGYWRKWWKLWSVWLSTFGILVLTFAVYFPQYALDAWNMLPPDIKNSIPPEFLQKISIGLWVASLISKFIKQKKLTQEHFQNDQNGETDN